MEHDWELFIPRPEILEIEVCNILYNPGNIGKWIFLLSHILEILENGFFQLPHILEILDRTSHTQSYPGDIGNLLFPFSHILEIRAAGGRRRAGGSRGCVVLPWIIFGTLFLDWGYVGMCLQPLFCCGTTPQGLFFRQKQHFSNFWTCPISGNSTFPWFWSLFGSYLALFGPYWALLSLIEPYWALLSLIEPYWALTVKQ